MKEKIICPKVKKQQTKMDLPSEIQIIIASYNDCVTRCDLFTLWNLPSNRFFHEADEREIECLQREVGSHVCAKKCYEWLSCHSPDILALFYNVLILFFLISQKAPIQMYIEMWWWVSWTLLSVLFLPSEARAWVVENIGFPAGFSRLAFFFRGLTWCAWIQSAYIPYVPSKMGLFMDTCAVFLLSDWIPRLWVTRLGFITSTIIDEVVLPPLMRILCSFCNRTAHADFKKKTQLISRFHSLDFKNRDASLATIHPATDLLWQHQGFFFRGFLARFLTRTWRRFTHDRDLRRRGRIFAQYVVDYCTKQQ